MILLHLAFTFLLGQNPKTISTLPYSFDGVLQSNELSKFSVSKNEGGNKVRRGAAASAVGVNLEVGRRSSSFSRKFQCTVPLIHGVVYQNVTPSNFSLEIYLAQLDNVSSSGQIKYKRW